MTTVNPPSLAAAPDHAARHAVVLFDGECNLCNRSVRFVLARDHADRFRFASLQSDTGRALLEQHKVTGAGAGENGSIVLIEQGEPSTRSTAALRIARRLNFPWRLLAVFLLVPRPLRDAAYNLVARNRYRWFGKTDSCNINPAVRAALQTKMWQ